MRITKALEYIEGNLSEPMMNHNQLAALMYYSPNHFRHIFILETGQNVGAYIRTRRLERARAQISGTNRTILDIALSNGFNSPQVFNRAFKRRYGVTPTELRKRRFWLTRALGIKTRRGTPMRNYELPPFTDEDRKQGIKAIHRMVALAQLARREGVLALEESVKNDTSYLLKKGITLVSDGVCPEVVRDILTTLMTYSQYTNAELLERLIYVEGALSIQAGENPRIIEEKLSTFLGEPFLAAGLYPATDKS